MERVDRGPRDEELVRRFLEGDREAFAPLVERHEQKIYNLALRMLGRPEDARDATQDAFLTALRRLNTFRGEAAFSTWLHRVAVNACYDAMRKRRRQPMLELDPELQEPNIAGPDTTAGVADAIDVRRALTLVPEDYRAVLILHDVQDLAYEEIASILDVPLGTVKSRLHRARISLARAMGIEAGGAGGKLEHAERESAERERRRPAEPSEEAT